MNLSKKEAIELIDTKGVDHFNSLGDVHVFNENGKEIKFTVEIEKKIEPAVEIEKNVSPITINKKDNKMEKKINKSREFWASAFKAKSNGAGMYLNTSDIVTKTTELSEVNAGYVDAVATMQEEIMDAPILSRLTFIPMTQQTLRLPVLRMSGTITSTPETSGKNAADGFDNYVLLTTECYNGYVTYSQQVLNDVPAFQAFAGRAITGMIQEDLEAKAIEDILAASGKYTYAGPSSGKFTTAQAIEMYSRLEQRGLKNPAWLLSPQNWAAAMSFDSGVRIIMDGPQALMLGYPVIMVNKLPVWASGAYGTAVLCGLGNVALGQQGTYQEDYNPFYGWTTNQVSTRVEVFADIAPTSNYSFVRTNGANSGWTSSHYVVLSGVA